MFDQKQLSDVLTALASGMKKSKEGMNKQMLSDYKEANTATADVNNAIVEAALRSNDPSQFDRPEIKKIAGSHADQLREAVAANKITDELVMLAGADGENEPPQATDEMLQNASDIGYMPHDTPNVGAGVPMEHMQWESPEDVSDRNVLQFENPWQEFWIPLLLGVKPAKLLELNMARIGEAKVQKKNSEYMTLYDRYRDFGLSHSDAAREASVSMGGYVHPNIQKFGSVVESPADKDIAGKEVTDFELQYYGRTTPELRGTEQYKEDYLEWTQQKKSASPYINAMMQNMQLQRRSAGTSLRKEFYDHSDVQNYLEIKARYDVMKSAMEEAKKTDNFVAVDQALITTFNKITDPDSVVRESEYARTSSDLSILNRLRGKFQKLEFGGAGLTDSDRKALTRMAAKFMNISQNKYRKRLHEYRGYVTNYGLDPDMYIKMDEQKESTPQEPPEEKVDYIWDGEKIVPVGD